jgi:hypothetical protein
VKNYEVKEDETGREGSTHRGDDFGVEAGRKMPTRKT